ncbi:hypothetical protein M0812_15366 [Anaeramoeba flamelloides]|uniref:Uncharacterized protein n=1 Tax=Anaeramoeba flamelloides TaxID=1746091 RepID=A0AAV7ZDR7_9EUKA|nr:hypothetical protein M0812_15366 [Anaeramoeba flamelloides]
MSISFPSQTELESKLNKQKEVLCRLASQVKRSKDEELTTKYQKYLIALYDMSTNSLKRNIILASVQSQTVSVFEKVINEEESKILLGTACQHLLKVINFPTHKQEEKEKKEKKEEKKSIELIKKALFQIPILTSKVIVTQILSNKMTKLADLLFEMVLEKLGEFQATKLLAILSHDKYEIHKKQHFEYILTHHTSKVLFEIVKRDLGYTLEFLEEKFQNIPNKLRLKIKQKYQIIYDLLMKNYSKQMIQLFSNITIKNESPFLLMKEKGYLAKKEPELFFQYLVKPLKISNNKFKTYYIQNINEKYIKYFSLNQKIKMAKYIIKYGTKNSLLYYIFNLPCHEQEIIFKLIPNVENLKLFGSQISLLSKKIRFQLVPRILKEFEVKKVSDENKIKSVLQNGYITKVRNQLIENINNSFDYTTRGNDINSLIICTIKSRNKEELTKTLKWLSIRTRNEQGYVRHQFTNAIFDHLNYRYLTINDLNSLKALYVSTIEARDSTLSSINKYQIFFLQMINYHYNLLKKLKFQLKNDNNNKILKEKEQEQEQEQKVEKEKQKKDKETEKEKEDKKEKEKEKEDDEEEEEIKNEKVIGNDQSSRTLISKIKIHKKWVNESISMLNFAIKNQKIQYINPKISKNISKQTILFLFKKFYSSILSEIKENNYMLFDNLLRLSPKYIIKNFPLLMKDISDLIFQNKEITTDHLVKLIKLYLQYEPKKRSERILKLFEEFNDKSLMCIQCIEKHVLKHLPDLLNKLNIFDFNQILNGKFFQFGTYIYIKNSKKNNLKKDEKKKSIEELDVVKKEEMVEESEESEEAEEEEDEERFKCIFLCRFPNLFKKVDSNLQTQYLEIRKGLIYQKKQTNNEMKEKTFILKNNDDDDDDDDDELKYDDDDEYYIYKITKNAIIKLISNSIEIKINTFKILLEIYQKDLSFVKLLLKSLTNFDSQYEEIIDILFQYMNDENYQKVVLPIIIQILNYLPIGKQKVLLKKIISQDKNNKKISFQKIVLRLYRDYNKEECLKMIIKLWNEPKIHKNMVMSILKTLLLTFPQEQVSWEILAHAITKPKVNNKEIIHKWFINFDILKIDTKLRDNWIELLLQIIEITDSNEIIENVSKKLKLYHNFIKRVSLNEKLNRMIKNQILQSEIWKPWTNFAKILYLQATRSEKASQLYFEIINEFISQPVFDKLESPKKLENRDNPKLNRLRYIIEKFDYYYPNGKPIINRFIHSEKIFPKLSKQLFQIFFLDFYILLKIEFVNYDLEKLSNFLLEIEQKIFDLDLKMHTTDIASSICVQLEIEILAIKKNSFFDFITKMSSSDSIFLRLIGLNLTVKYGSGINWDKKILDLLLQFTNDKSNVIRKKAYNAFFDK